MSPPLSGRSAIITGASAGLGKAIARAFVDAGANVCLGARDAVKLDAVARELTERASADQRVRAMACDVANAADVDRLVGAAEDACGSIEILVNNAGVYGPMGPIESVDWDAWVRAIEINLFGSVLMVRRVLPHFKARGYGKIVQLSGGGATNPLPRLTAYAASKAAVVRFAESIALEVASFGIDVNAVAPGALNTGMMDELIAAGPDVVGADMYARMKRIADEGGTPLDVGAALAVFLASAESDGITGRLLSAPWDDWRELPRRRETLAQSDVYTIRRIVPADRGFDWGKS